MLKKKKKNGVAIALGILLLSGLSWLLAESSAVKKDYVIKPTQLAAVNFQDNFWQKRIDTDIKVTIPHVFKQEEQTGRLKNLSWPARRDRVIFVQITLLTILMFIKLLRPLPTV